MRGLDRSRAGTNGSEDRWRDVFEAHYPGLVRHVAHLTGDRAAAEDIAQEAFLRLVHRPPRSGGDPAPWLHVVASRLAFNYLRGEKRRRAREEALHRDPALAPEGARGPAAAWDGPGDRQAVRAALDRLPARDRTALLLRSAGRPYAEIAAALGVRTGSVGTILARATVRLRRAYERECEGATPAGTARLAPAESARVRRG